MILGCIGDDFTGSSDIASTLAAGGMRTVLYPGIPGVSAAAQVEAGVVALKSRTIPAAEAVAQSLAALDWLKAQGCRQVVLKYCSTFDSTPEGNIGPVAQALADALGAKTVIFCPAFPSLGRSLYAGHLFVGDRLLNESGMENHPLTPMVDPDIRRWLARQTSEPVGLVPASVVLDGRTAIRAALSEQQHEGVRFSVIDTLRDADLVEIAAATAELPLLTGGSGIALGLPENYRAQGLIGEAIQDWPGNRDRAIVLSGSCARATRAQVATHRRLHPALAVTADAVMDGTMSADRAAEWARAQSDPVPMIYSSADPAQVALAQQKYGRYIIAARLEQFFSDTARRLVADGFGRIIVAGGETSGAVVQSLKVAALDIGPPIAPGVPALRVCDGNLTLALKSGNFGTPDFFDRAAGGLAGQ